MDEFTLTKEANALISTLYKEYLNRKQKGVDDRQTRSFGDASSIEKLLKADLKKHRRKAFEKEPTKNTADICRELHNAKLLNCFLSTIPSENLN